MSAGYLKKCSNGRDAKRSYDTREEADRQRQSLIRIGRYSPGRSNVYLCNQCGKFHVGQTRGSKPATRSKSKNRRPRLDTQ